MYTYLINNGLAFIEGFALIISPCILPILPIILAGGVTGGKQRPIGIIIGFTLFFALFALLSGELIRHIGINLDIVRKISYVLIALFGLILISDNLSQIFSRLTQRLADKGGDYADKNQGSGLWSGILFGALVSLIWVPCGGPILAAAIVSMAVQKTFLDSFITFLFFALGSVLPMILIVIAGKKIMSKTSFLKKHAHILRKSLGALIVLMALLLGFTGIASTWLTSGGDNNKATEQALSSNTLIDGLSQPYPAPALNTDTIWLNSPPLAIEQLKGKVVLIDFWTYSCINCIRTLPYLHHWYQQYHDKGLVIIGVHAPEFEFEKKLDNVKQAIKQYDIKYPVVLDNDYVIWQNYHNQYWPAHYLIDKKGYVVSQHFGEGNYAQTEHDIRVLLGLTNNMPNIVAEPLVSSAVQTPETYLGYARADTYQGTPAIKSLQTSLYHFRDKLEINHWALDGQWLVQAQYIQAVDTNTAIKLHFIAKNVYVVMGSVDNKPIKVSVLLNGKPITTPAGQTHFIVDRNNLYPVLSLPKTEDAELELRFDKPGVTLYTFTFG